MIPSFTRAALVLAALGVAAPAIADDAWKGPSTHNPNSAVRMHAYPTAVNYCPAGTQPVLAGGEISCGVPNAPAYVDRPGGMSKLSYRAGRRHATPGAYAPVGEKGVVYR